MSSTITKPPRTKAAVVATVSESPPSPSEWDQIRTAMTPEFQFLACNWVEPWGKHLRAEEGWEKPFNYFIVHDRDGHVVAAVPFAQQTKAKARFRSLAGLYVPLRGLPISQAAIPVAVECLANHLTENHHGMGLRLAPIAAKDPALGPLIDGLRKRGWRASSTHNGFRQIITLPKTFDEYEAVRKGSRWKTISKRERKMEREHDVRLALFTTEKCENWAPVIRDLGEVQQHSWLPEQAGDMWFVGDAHVRFWTDVFNAQRRGLTTRIWVLYFDGKPVTFDFNIDSGGCRYSIVGSYIKDVHKYGTGSILMKHMVRDAIDRGIDKIDMGIGNTGYKTFWGAEMADALVDWIAYPPGLRGLGMYGAATLLQAARATRSRLQQVKARLFDRAKTTE